MWIYKYGLNFSREFKLQAMYEAAWMLKYRFVEMPPKHPDKDIQDIIDELYPEVRVYVDDATGNVPSVYALRQNYPNPFNPSTNISYSLPKASRVTLRVFNTLGQQVAVLVDDEKDAGVYQVRWNAGVPSAVYFYRLQAGPYTETKKMMLLR
jgi:hypothetical protein